MCEQCFNRPVTTPLRRALGHAMKAAREFDEATFDPDPRALAAAREARREALDRLLGEMLPALGIHVPAPESWGEDDVISLGLPADMAG